MVVASPYLLFLKQAMDLRPSRLRCAKHLRIRNVIAGIGRRLSHRILAILASMKGYQLADDDLD
jgi:hypothetical protein